MIEYNFQNPITDPVIAFTILMFSFLFFPLLSKRLRIPSIIGLLFAGIIIGPHGLNLVSKDIGITLFGTVGLLYLMFIVALEINLRDFNRLRKQSLVFGAFTFLFPLILGFIVTHFIFKLPLYSAILYSSIFSTHTLISYPIVAKYGISNHKTMAITVGGTIITDTAVLLLLTIISSLVENDTKWYFFIELIIRFTIFSFIVLYIFPKISKWFLRNLQGDHGLQYISIIFLVFLAALIAQLLEIEPLIGAFFAGLALNKLIPPKSPLMNRIMFIGQNLFIPFFIISIGMLINLSLFITDYKTLIFSAAILVVAIFTKYLAALAIKRILNYTWAEQQLIFGLSTSHAAATIAVVVVGNRIGLFDESIMNSAIILIFISSLVSSFVTERAAQIVSSQLKEKKIVSAPIKIDRILVPISNPDNINQLLDFSMVLKSSQNQIPIYPLTVISDFKKAHLLMDAFHKSIDQYAIEVSSTEHLLNPIVKKDISVVNGILTSASQNNITKIIIGWNGKITASNFFLGTLLENLIHKANQMIVVVKLNRPIEEFDKIRVFISLDAAYETGFNESIESILSLSEHLKIKPLFFSSEETLTQIKNIIELRLGSDYGEFEISNNWIKIQETPPQKTYNELTLSILARPMLIKFNSNNEKVTKNFSKNYDQHSFVIIYPGIDEIASQIL